MPAGPIRSSSSARSTAKRQRDSSRTRSRPPGRLGTRRTALSRLDTARTATSRRSGQHLHHEREAGGAVLSNDARQVQMPRSGPAPTVEGRPSARRLHSPQHMSTSCAAAQVTDALHGISNDPLWRTGWPLQNLSRQARVRSARSWVGGAPYGFLQTCRRPGGHGGLYRWRECGTVQQPSLRRGEALLHVYSEMYDADYLAESGRPQADRRAASRPASRARAERPATRRRAVMGSRCTRRGRHLPRRSPFSMA